MASSSSVLPHEAQDVHARDAAPSVELIVCATCRIAGREPEPSAPSCGQTLHDALQAELAQRQVDVSFAVRTTRCFWVCKRSCAVQIRSPGRVGYLLCELDPRAGAAQALLDYAELYARSAEGAVPFREWPAGVRGHFLCRIPPSDPQPDPEDPA
jgi:predicted metal-binding protein